MSKWNCLRADSRLSPIQWETSLQSNAVSHWLCANLESALSPAAYINPSQYSHVIPSDMISVILQHADTIRIDSWSTMRTFQSFVLCARMTSCTISAMANNIQLEFESSIHGWEYRPLWHCQYKKKLSYQNRTRNCYYKDKIDGSMQEWRKSSELAMQATLLSNKISLIQGSRIKWKSLSCPQFCPYSYQILCHVGGTSPPTGHKIW